MIATLCALGWLALAGCTLTIIEHDVRRSLPAVRRALGLELNP